MNATDKNGTELNIGDMVRVHERYRDWLGIIDAIYQNVLGSFTLMVKPIGWISSPLFAPAEFVEKIDVEQATAETMAVTA